MSIEMSVLKNRVSAMVTFVFFCDGNLWYSTADGWNFPVPTNDTGGDQSGPATFYREMKGIYMMRWIRKHMELETQLATTAE